MREPTRFETWHGRDEPPVERRELRAGPLTAQLEGIDLRYVTFEGIEAVRRIFVAVRDAAWGTIPPRVGELEVDAQADSFRVSFEASHEAGGLRFRWRGELAGESDGSLDCRLDGVADSDFEYNRIGFCVLHPRENAGRPYRARTPDGDLSGALPDTIGPQRFEDGKLWPLFPSYDRLEIELAAGVRARFEFEGDLFEMEDQRNWTDASFKTYSTPITLGWPHRAQAGQEIGQRVRLSFDRARRRAPVRRKSSAEIELGEPLGKSLPALGLGVASHGGRLSQREADLLRALRLDHLRADLHLGGNGWEEELARASEDAEALGARLQLALLLGDEPEAELDALAARRADVARFLVFKTDEVATGARWVRLARERLGGAFPQAVFAGGTNQWFTELNRERPDLDGVDAVAYSVNATVHSDDDTSVMETPAAQGDTVRSARAVAGVRQVIVSPVTIRPRSWPFGELEGYRGLPYQVDPRQCALFGAAWTAASVKHLTEAGAAAVTYFETTGWRGVMETEAGPADPEHFRSRPGAVFPLYHVLADVAEWKDGEVVEARSSEPLAVQALAVRTDSGTHLLVCNLTAEEQSGALLDVPARTVAVRVLDEESARRSADEPERFRAERSGSRSRTGKGGNLHFGLRPYAVTRIDLV